MEEENNKIEERKKKIVNFFSGRRNIWQYVLLFLIIFLGAWIRSQGLENLKDQTTGEYISLELDSTIFLRYAEYIAEHGELFKIDPMRFYPLGGDITYIGTFVSYFVAYLYNFLKIFNPGITVEYADIIYPIVATGITILFFFLLLRRVFDYRVALLASLLLNVSTGFIFRSTGGSSDHDSLVMMFIVMSFYFYVASLQSQDWKKYLFAILAGTATGFGRMTGSAIIFVFMTIGFTTLLEIIFDRFDRNNFYSLLLWILPATIIPVGAGKTTLAATLMSVTTFVAYFSLIVGAIYLYVFRNKRFEDFFSKIYKGRKVPEGILCIIFCSVAGLIASFFIFSDFFNMITGQIYNLLFEAYGETRWTLTVAENRKSYLVDWFSQYGKIYIYLFIL